MKCQAMFSIKYKYNCLQGDCLMWEQVLEQYFLKNAAKNCKCFNCANSYKCLFCKEECFSCDELKEEDCISYEVEDLY